MSQSLEELKDALKFGRCPICDGIKCVGYPESCTCCGNCGNLQSGCVCCPVCKDTKDVCSCPARILPIWNEAHSCVVCPYVYVPSLDRNEAMFHQKGERCPSCCLYCKEFIPECTCCIICGTTPCICCDVCKNFPIKCKCWSARILSHFIRRAVLSVLYHEMQRQLDVCPCPNTRYLLRVKDDD